MNSHVGRMICIQLFHMWYIYQSCGEMSHLPPGSVFPIYHLRLRTRKRMFVRGELPVLCWLVGGLSASTVVICGWILGSCVLRFLWQWKKKTRHFVGWRYSLRNRNSGRPPCIRKLREKAGFHVGGQLTDVCCHQSWRQLLCQYLPLRTALLWQPQSPQAYWELVVVQQGVSRLSQKMLIGSFLFRGHPNLGAPCCRLEAPLVLKAKPAIWKCSQSFPQNENICSNPQNAIRKYPSSKSNDLAFRAWHEHRKTEQRESRPVWLLVGSCF